MAQITQNGNQWTISGDVVLLTVSAILKASQTFAMSQHITVDFADVTDIDTAAISLILEWQRRATKEKQSISCIHLPANLTSLVDLYGVADLIH